MAKQQSKSILIATIGTRDLALMVADNEWLNVGNDRAIGVISEQALVLEHLQLSQQMDFLSLSEYLCAQWSEYQERLQPIIIGKLLQDKSKNLKKIYLVGTNQPENSRFREKDTLYSAKLIKLWLEKHYQIPTEIIEQGNNGENPSDFEAMFDWWKKTWVKIEKEGQIEESTKILLCLKGGVNQSSEAARITAISRFAEKTYFYDFIQNEQQNSLGKPSAYTKPFRGTNYLWDRRQSEALSLLDRWDYSAVYKVLNPYWQTAEDDEEIFKIKNSLEIAIQWNMADFESLATSQSKTLDWWSPAYETAYLGVIRFKQGSTTEAMFHTFRAVEGLIVDWIKNEYKPHVKKEGNKWVLKQTICSDEQFLEFKNSGHIFEQRTSDIDLFGTNLDKILKIAEPNIKTHPDWKTFFNKTRNSRNRLFHNLQKLDKEEVLKAWISQDSKQWESKILSCLNFLSKQTFNSLESASYMSRLHNSLKDKIKAYKP